MNIKIINLLFGMIVFSLPFKYIPKPFWQLFWGGPFGQDLVAYPLILGFLYTCYCVIRYNLNLVHWDILKKFLIAYLGTLFISLLWGVYTFPYYDQVVNGPITQIRQLPGIIKILTHFGIHADKTLILEILIIIRPIKGIFFETLYTFGGAYMIYIWYHDRVQQAIKILQNVVIFDLIIIVFYGLIDVCYQNGQMWAQNVLAIVNPILHDSPSINWSAVEFHPGLFWNGQVRSIFLEPSYFGNFMAFAFPILWWKICDTNGNNNKIGLFLLFIVLTFEVILSKSRTGALVLLGETVLYVVVVVYRKDRRLFTMGLSGIIAFLIAFGTANLFSKYAQFPVNWMGGRLPLATFKSEGKIPEETIALGDIIDSLFNKEKTSIEKQESNHSRLTITKTDFIIGKEHILLGVGKSMRSAYLRDKLANDPGREIQDWNRRADENGVLSADGMYFAGCDYTSRFSETGILGIILYCLPIVSVSWIYLHKVFNRQMPMTEIYPFLFCGISLAGMMVSGVGDALTLTFCPWMALGISFLLCFG